MTKKRSAGERTKTADWNEPKCSACREPILLVEDALAGWLVDSKNENHSPFLIHRGDCFSFVKTKERDAMSIAVAGLRRAPMVAIAIALNRHADSEAARNVWHDWVSVVLGLPSGEEASLLASGPPADYLPDHVLTLEEAERDIRRH